MTRDLFYSTISAASAALLLALMWVAAQIWNVEDYGVFNYAISVAAIAEAFMDLGIHQVTIRTIARDANRAGHLLYTTALLKTAPSLLVIAAFGVGVMAVRADAVGRTACWLMLAAAAMRSYQLTARGILQGLGRFDDDALVTLADRALLLAACGVAIWQGATVVQASVVFLAVRIATAAAALWLARLRSGQGTFDRGLARTLPAEALPIGLFLLVLVLYNRIDMTMLGSLGVNQEANDFATGMYSAAYTLYEGLTYPAAILSAVLVPRLSRTWLADQAKFGRLFGRGIASAAAVAIVVALASWVVAGKAMELYSSHLIAATTTLRILILGLPAIYMIWIMHGVAVAAHRTRTLIVVTTLGTVLNVLLNLWWIPSYSYDGSAAATVVSEYVVSAILWAALRTTRQRPSPQAAQTATAA